MARVWAGVKRWALNLAAAYVSVAGFGIVITAVGSLWSGHPHWTMYLGYALALGLGLLAAAIWRGYIDGLYVLIEDFGDDCQVWLYDHPVVTFGGWAVFSLFGTATSHHLLAVLIGFPILTLIGWFNIWRWQRRITAVLV